MADTEKSGALQLGSLRAANQAMSIALDMTASPDFQWVDRRWRDSLIAGVVQRIECIFDLCWKMLERQLECELANGKNFAALALM